MLTVLLCLAILENFVSTNSNMYVWIISLVNNEAIDTVLICNVFFKIYMAFIVLITSQIDSWTINNVLLIPSAICCINLMASFRHSSLEEGHEITVSVNYIVADINSAISFCFCND